MPRASFVSRGEAVVAIIIAKLGIVGGIVDAASEGSIDPTIKRLLLEACKPITDEEVAKYSGMRHAHL